MYSNETNIAIQDYKNMQVFFEKPPGFYDLWRHVEPIDANVDSWTTFTNH